MRTELYRRRRREVGESGAGRLRRGELVVGGGHRAESQPFVRDPTLTRNNERDPFDSAAGIAAQGQSAQERPKLEVIVHQTADKDQDAGSNGQKRKSM